MPPHYTSSDVTECVAAQTISPLPQKSHKIVTEVALKIAQKHFNLKRECFVLTYQNIQQPA